MLYFLSGSVNSATMLYWIGSDEDVKNGTWQDHVTAEKRYRSQVANEYAFFFKDDWKLTRRVTLNLGVRYEYYAPPYLRRRLHSVNSGPGVWTIRCGPRHGATFRHLAGTRQPLSYRLWTQYHHDADTDLRKGVTQSSLLPTSTCDPNNLTSIEFVGPDSDKPESDGDSPRTATTLDLQSVSPGKFHGSGKGRQPSVADSRLPMEDPAAMPTTLKIFSVMCPATTVQPPCSRAIFLQLVNATRALTLVDLPAHCSHKTYESGSAWGTDCGL